MDKCTKPGCSCCGTGTHNHAEPDFGGPAFPVLQTNTDNRIWIGMTLRDYFAGQALTGWIADKTNTHDGATIAKHCYDLADAMILKREEKN